MVSNGFFEKGIFPVKSRHTLRGLVSATSLFSNKFPEEFTCSLSVSRKITWVNI